MTSNYIQSYINTGHGQEPARNFVIYAPINISIITGYYVLTSPSTINLSDVSTAVTITVLNSPQPNSLSVDPANINYFYILQAGSYAFQINYTDTVASPNITYTDFVSFTAVLPIYLPQANDIYNVIKRSEPQYVYTQLSSNGIDTYANEYVDSFSTATAFSSLYQDLSTVYANTLPSGGSPDWELTLNNTVGLLSNTPVSNVNNPYYNIILDMLYSLLVNNTGNKFDVSLFLSKYIYYRTNKAVGCAVAIVEATVILPAIWILGSSRLGIDTVLGDVIPIYQVNVYFIPQTGIISQDLQNELTNLVPRLLPEGYNYLTYFNATLTSIGMTSSIGQTWKYDPRLGSFAIEYISTDVNQAIGWVNPTAPQALVSIAMTLPSGPLTPGTYTFVITGTYYSGVTADLTLECTVISTNTAAITIATANTFVVNSVPSTSVILNFNYGSIFGNITYTVT